MWLWKKNKTCPTRERLHSCLSGAILLEWRMLPDNGHPDGPCFHAEAGHIDGKKVRYVVNWNKYEDRFQARQYVGIGRTMQKWVSGAVFDSFDDARKEAQRHWDSVLCNIVFYDKH